MQTIRFDMTTLASLVLSACASLPYTPPALPPVTQPATAAAEQRSPVTILVSIDGFRADYLDRGVTPVLSKLAADGVSAAMRPSFRLEDIPQPLDFGHRAAPRSQRHRRQFDGGSGAPRRIVHDGD